MKGDSIMEYLLEEYGDVIICITGLAIAFTFLGICMNKVATTISEFCMVERSSQSFNLINEASYRKSSANNAP